MTRFFFHQRDGGDEPDKTGVELASLDLARIEAIKALGEALCDDPEGFWKTGARQMTVADAEGLTLFTLDVMANDAPATSPRRT